MSAPQLVVADADRRLRALDPATSFIVQAPAGSGKTELLTRRVLVLLATVEEPEEVVAITFTRKAAAEMRHRIFTAIRSALSDPEPQDDYQRETWQLARAALAHSRARSWGLEDNPQRLRVLTIDALCMLITQQSPLTAGFGGQVRVAEHPQPAYREAARAVLDLMETLPEMAAPVRRVLAHFDNRVGLLENQLVGLLARRDQWLPLVTQGRRAGQTRATLEAALRAQIDSALAEAGQQLPQALRSRWLQSAAYAASRLAADAPQAPLTAALQDFCGETGWPAAEADELPRWRTLLELVLTQDGGWRKVIDKRAGFPAGKTKAEKAEWGPPRDAHLQLLAELGAQPERLPALQRLRELPAPRYSDAQWEVLEALLDTLLLAAAQLRIAFMARGEVDFAEVATQAVHALGDEDQPSDLALRLDYRIRHLLVDEFQDTSSSQWKLLTRLTAGWQPGDGRSLFVVGDPMQSVYRFREAEVALFLRAQEQGVAAITLQPLGLTVNFRSDAGVVDWVNAAFRQVFPARADADRGGVPYTTATAMRAAGPEPAVTVHAFVGEPPEAEAQRVIELVQRARAADPQQRIAVLVRSRGHLAAISPALRAAQLPYRALEIEGLAARPVIDDLKSLTRALLHPADRIAWLALLRAPWCGLSLADLDHLVTPLGRRGVLLHSLRDESLCAGLSAEGRTRVAGLMQVLEPALAQQGREPLRRWLESVWVGLGGPAVAGDTRDLLDARSFFERIESLAEGPELADLELLDLALDTLKAAPDPAAGEALTLMTIHKSKGLEFDTVIVPGLGRGTRNDDLPPIAWASLSGNEDEPQLLLAPVHATGDEPGDSFRFIRTLEAEKQRHEDARLLYVAVTRARRQLHLLGNVPASGGGTGGALREPPARSLLARLWPVVAPAFATAAETMMAAATAPPAEGAGDNAEAHPRPPPLRRLVAGWAAPALRPGLATVQALERSPGETVPFDWAGETARAVGLIYHRWMQQIAREGVDDWDGARVPQLQDAVTQALADEGVPESRRADAQARVLRALEQTLGDARGRWLLQAHPAARSEWALTAQVGGQLRRLILDRSFVDAERDERWIVDFKTSVHEGGDLDGFLQQERERYREQLEGYRSALRQLEARPVRVALYLPLMPEPEQRWQELPPP